MLFRSSLRSSHCNHMFKEFGPKKAPSGQYTVPVTTVPPTVSPFGFLRSSHRPGCLASLAGARRTTRAPARVATTESSTDDSDSSSEEAGENGGKRVPSWGASGSLDMGDCVGGGFGGLG